MAYTTGQKIEFLGSALSGRVPQFQQQMEQLDEKRMEAMYKDAGAAYDLFNKGNISGIIDLANDRLNILQRLPGSDPSDTMQVLQLAQGANAGNPQSLSQLGQVLGSAYQQGIARGYVAAPVAPEEYTLSENQVRMRGSEVIARGPQAAETPAKPSAREEKITDLITTFGMDRASAIRAIETQRFVNPVTGNLMTYDPITNEAKALDAEIPTTEPPRTSMPGISPEMLSFNVTKGTGFVSSALDLLDRTIGQTGLFSAPTNTREAGQKMQLLTRDAIKALASSNRPPVIEQKMIMDIVPQPYQWMENPETAQYQTIAFLDLLGQQYLDDKRYSENPNNPKAERESSQRRQREIERVMYSVLTPEAAETIFSGIDTLEQEVGDILNMSIEELEAVDVMALSDAQLDVYIERLSGQ
jgi:hypothetical protein